MKKILSLLLCFFFMLNVFSFLSATTAYAAAGTLLSEGFESSVNGSTPSGWAIVNVNNTSGSWTFVSTGSSPSVTPKSGSKMAKFNSYDASSGHSTRLYMTQGINLGNVYGNNLYFSMYHDTGYYSNADCIQVQVSTNGGSTWTNLGTAINRYDGTTGWKEHSLNLDSYITYPDLRIAFLAISQYGNNMYIDDVSVTSTNSTISVTSITLNKVSTGMNVGGTEQLTATVSPSNATNKNISWALAPNSYPAVTVSSSGLVTATKSGIGVVRATSVSDPSVYAECTVAVSDSAPGTSTLSEDFESGNGLTPPTGWAVQDVSGTAGDWSFKSSGTYPTVNAPISGSKMASFNSYNASSGSSTRLYKTSGFPIGDLTGNTLYFWMYHDTGYSNCSDRIQVQVSVDGGSTWINVGNPIYRYDSTPGWKEHAVSLDQHMHMPDVRLGFLATSGYGNNIFLDKVSYTDPKTLIPVTGVTLNTTSVNLSAGQTQLLTATVSPSNASNKYVNWSVRNQSCANVASVSPSGLVTGMNPGTAVIRATSCFDSYIYAECAVTVTAFYGTVLSDGFENNTGSTLDGWTSQTLSGSTGAWSVVSSGSYPTVSTPKSGVKMAKFNSVSAYSGDKVRIYNNTGFTLDTSGSYKLDFWMYHSTDYSTSNDYIQVQICTDGYIGSNWVNVGSPVNRYDGSTGWKKHTISLDSYKGMSNLHIALLATSLAGYNMYIDDFSITKPEAIVSLNKTAVSIGAGQTSYLTATVTPDDLPNKSVTWSIPTQSGSNIATVSGGCITALNPGTAVVRATSVYDTSKYAECAVTVLVPVTSVSLNTTSASISIPDTLQLQATASPAEAGDSSMKWEVKNESTYNVATVSTTGLVTAHNAGTAVIRASSVSNPDKYAECALTVTNPTVPVIMMKSSTVIMAGRYEHLYYSMTPGLADTSVAWSVVSQSAENVATMIPVDITTTGLLSALNEGTAVIRVSSVVDPNIYADCNVTVVPPTWTSHTSGSNQRLTAVTYGNNKYVAIGEYGAVSTSVDGISWSYRPSGLSGNFYGIAYGNGKYIIVGGGGFIAISTDGITWTKRTSGTTNALNDIVFGNGKFVAAGEAGTILTSTDGISWSTQTSGLRGAIYGVAYGNGKFVAAGTYGSGIISSSDGAVWSQPAPGISSWVTRATFGDGKFVVYGVDDVIYTSTDGLTWTSTQASGLDFYVCDIAYGNGKYVLVGSTNEYTYDGVIATSSDGATWDKQIVGSALGIGSIFMDITFENGKFVTVEYDGEILTSP